MFLKTHQLRSQHFCKGWTAECCAGCASPSFTTKPRDAKLYVMTRHWATAHSEVHRFFFLSKSHFDHSFYKNYLCMKNGEPEIWFFQPDYVNLVFVTSRQHAIWASLSKNLWPSVATITNYVLQKNKTPTINGVDQSENPIFIERKPNQNIPLTINHKGHIGNHFCSHFQFEMNMSCLCKYCYMDLSKSTLFQIL